MVQSIPGCQFAFWMYQHWIGRRTILWKLFVCIIWAHQSELDWINRICQENLLIKSSIDHGGFWTISSNQMNRFGRILLSFWSVNSNKFSWKSFKSFFTCFLCLDKGQFITNCQRVCQNTWNQPLEGIYNLFLCWIWLSSETPPRKYDFGCFTKKFQNFVMDLPPIWSEKLHKK